MDINESPQKPLHLTEGAIREVVREHAPFLGALIDTAPSYKVGPSDIAALITRLITGSPALGDAILASALRMSLPSVQRMPPLERLFRLAGIVVATIELHSIEDLVSIVLGELQPSSMLMSGRRH